MTFYTPNEVAALLKITRRTVYGWVRTGRLKACKINGTVRIPEAELMAVLQPFQPESIRRKAS